MEASRVLPGHKSKPLSEPKSTAHDTTPAESDEEKDNREVAENTELVPPYITIQWLLPVLAVYASAFLYGLDTTIVSVVQGPVVSSFGNVEKLGWLGIGFPLGSIATIAAWAKAYGIFDTMWMYIGSLVHFVAGSALCAAAPNMMALIVGRVWAGAGCAGMYLGQLNIWSQNTTLERRFLYISGGGIVWGVGCILGPIVGGAFADSTATWRWAFYINLVLFGILSPVYLFVINSHMPRPREATIKMSREFDWLGITLTAAMYTSFVLSFAIGGTIWSWSDRRTIGSIVALAILVVLLGLPQRFCIFTTRANRVFPIRFLHSRTFLLLFVAQSCIQTALAIPIYYIPLIFQFTRADTAMTSAVRLLPFVIVNIAVVFLNGALLPKWKYYLPWYLVAGIFNTLGGALFLALLNQSTSSGAIYGFSILLAIGTGLAQQCAYSIATAKVPDQVADAIGFINNAQVGSVVIALTFTSLIFQNVGFNHIKDALVGLDFTNEEVRGALGGAKSRMFDKGVLIEEVRVGVEKGIVEAIRWSFFPVLLSGALGLVASLCMRWENVFEEETVAKNEKTEQKVQE
ncbi:MFS general substrate transporter [Cucurbitaria berberidis CBS 394.84]|uniref:MFS general substrate transporter n=1 Tax=Cucurbitaria berberidis CBS 394.84 TaxID=1168544 RepID=A0A9P4GKE2_9PLEO|nr:MFS general substrate transporter [Cucurbitaria berberidis CBS 394.84]KAF1846961.1 MFS general substrate transporter [Cucurbitaria berberidis CBS 394.84]